MNPDYAETYRDRDDPDPIEATGLFAHVDQVHLSWSRRLPLEDYLVWLHSKSYVAALGEREAEFIEAERASLSAAFPDGVVDEPFTVELVMAHTATAR